MSYEFDYSCLDSIPSFIRFGTSSWNYDGWRGLVYKKDYKSKREFVSQSLEEYAAFPFFKSVGIDHSFYKPPSSGVLLAYARMVPEDFRWVSKVWERITIPVYPKHTRYGDNAGKENPDFLNFRLFQEKVLNNYLNSDISRKTGPFVFQFPPVSDDCLHRVNFLERLQRFLEKLPGNFRYATEIRNPSFLNADYFGILNRFSVSHCFSHWNFMPDLRSQMEKAAEAGGIKAPFFVARILTPSGVSYEGAVKMFSPYSTIKKENPKMRRDVVRLVKRAIEKNKEAYIIINNRSEGNAPMTIEAICKMIKSKLKSFTP